MNAAEHAAAAEKLLAAVMANDDEAPCADDSTRIVANAIAAARVHATLAQLDYLREIGDQLDVWHLKIPRDGCREVNEVGRSCILAAGHPLPHLVSS